MEWTEGRKLASVTYNNKETAFEYNHEGLRIKKTLSDDSYILYEIVNGVYVGETRYNTSGSVAVYIRYILDEGNSPVGISLWYPATGGWTDYHFVKNLQGDVLEVYKVSDGSLAASYTYDSWGNILSQSGDLATLNPFRYRSYYYDTQTWFYYLQSRYYDPAIGRFINADNYPSTGQGIIGNNMFAYCGNNPISRKDTNGEAFETVFDIVSLGFSIAEVAANPYDPWAWAGLAGDVIDVAIPFVGGIGEATRLLRAADAVGDARDAVRAADRADDAMELLLEGACFVAGTEVLAEGGSIPIESIRKGDFVWAWDEETGDVALKEIVETYVNQTDELIHVFVNGEEIISTPTHPFYSPVKGWTSAVHLRAGDILVLVNGEYVVVEKVQHEILEAPVTVYNFQVKDFHTYYVADIGVLVHNTCATQRGLQRQKAAGMTNTTHITTPSGSTRIPDYLNVGQKVMGEAKSVKYLTKSSQLMDMFKYADANGYKMFLKVERWTKISKPLQKAIQQYNVALNVF